MENMNSTKSLFFGSLISVFLSFSLTGQSSLLYQKINLELEDATLLEALELIQETSDVTFSYDKRIMPVETFNERYQDTQLRTILDELTTGTSLSYEVIQKTIVIYNDDRQGSVIEEEEESTFTISGTVYDDSNKELLIGATIVIDNRSFGTTTNAYGFYSLTVPSGEYQIAYSYLGYEQVVKATSIDRDMKMDIDLPLVSKDLTEVVITDRILQKEEHVTSTDMGKVGLGIKTINRMPAFLGEVDLIKSLTLLPGVTSVGDGSSGFSVRGGNVDENLILLDEAPVYNTSHLAGLFSTFNPDAMKDISFYKGGFPSRYGGRLSSVADIKMKDGNRKKFAARGGIGTVMSRLSLETPLGKNGSLIVSGRRNYLDLFFNALLSLVPNGNGDELLDLDLFFYDLNAKATYKINDNNRVYLSGFLGRDVYGATILGDFGAGISWGNTSSTLRWNHIYNPKLFSNVTYYLSNFDYAVSAEASNVEADWNARLQEHGVKGDFVYYINPTQTLNFGVNGIRYQIAPATITGEIAEQFLNTVTAQTNRAVEASVYIEHEWEVNDDFKVDIGLRFSSFHNYGQQNLVRLDALNNLTRVDTVSSGVYNSYWTPEPRLKVRYQIDEHSSLKANYTRNSQYIQLASNGVYTTPFDVWFSSSHLIEPQIADQVGIGYFRNLAKGKYQFSVEGFYKSLRNTIDFKENANLIFKEYLETELRAGRGEAYGFELQLKKDIGELTGWLGYTYSRSRRQIPTINNDRWYSARSDIPHVINAVAIYEINQRVTLGTNFVFSTGQPATLVTGQYDFQGTSVPIYSERNGARIPDYHRLDLSLTLQGKKNKFKKIKREWVFSIFNVYGRRNAFNIRIGESSNGNFIAEQVAIFTLVPAITLNFNY